MKNNSLRERITKLIERWKMLSTSQVRDFLSQDGAVNDQSLFTTLKRMRMANDLHSTRLGALHLNFEPHWKKGQEFLAISSTTARRKAFRSKGLIHHNEMTELFLNWKREFPYIEALPNISAHKSVNSKSIGGKLRIPDLAIRLSPSSSLYIEYERTLKTSRIYQEKWWTYEDDGSVKTCLYWLEDPAHSPALEKIAEEFFRRTIGREDFSLGFIPTEAFNLKRFDAMAKLYSLQGCAEKSLVNLLDDAPMTAQKLSKAENFSPSTTQYDLAFSARETNSPPSTSSNDWVLKDERGEFASRAP